MVNSWIPWWLNRLIVPSQDANAQAVWLFGQWEFIPVTNSGIPLRRRCSSVIQALTEINYYERAVQELTEYINSFHEDTSTDNISHWQGILEDYKNSTRLPVLESTDNKDLQDYRIFGLFGMSKDRPCLVMYPDLTLYNYMLNSFSEAEVFIFRASPSPYERPGVS